MASKGGKTAVKRSNAKRNGKGDKAAVRRSSVKRNGKGDKTAVQRTNGKRNGKGKAPAKPSSAAKSSNGRQDGDRQERRDWAQKVKDVGGLLVVVVGLTAIAGIAAGAMVAGSQLAAAIAGSATAVVGSVVGAYLGVKIGTDQTKSALQGEREAAAESHVLAAIMTADQRKEAAPVLEEAKDKTRS